MIWIYGTVQRGTAVIVTAPRSQSKTTPTSLCSGLIASALLDGLRRGDFLCAAQNIS